MEVSRTLPISIFELNIICLFSNSEKSGSMVGTSVSMVVNLHRGGCLLHGRRGCCTTQCTVDSMYQPSALYGQVSITVITQ